MRRHYEKNREAILAKAREKRKHLSDTEKGKSRQAQAEWRENNREHFNAQKREYWANNREHLLEKREENYQKRKPEILRQQALYRENNKTLARIKELRDRQKTLALRMFDFSIERALNTRIQELLPT